MIGNLVGSGYYDQPGFAPAEVETRHGRVTVWHSRSGRPIPLISRHGAGHAHLSHQVNHRANLLEFTKLGVTAVVSCSVFGVDQANSLVTLPTTSEVLKSYLVAATRAFRSLIEALAEPAGGFQFANFVYRFGT